MLLILFFITYKNKKILILILFRVRRCALLLFYCVTFKITCLRCMGEIRFFVFTFEIT